MTANFTAQCQCGHIHYSIRKTPTLRLICHCSICQAFNQKAFADVCVLPAKHVHSVERDKIVFERYRKPPAVNRGRCAHCQMPAIEFFSASSLLPELAIVPSDNINEYHQLPPPRLHMFYESHQQHCTDDLPKYRGYLRSQMGMAHWFIRGLAGL